MKTCGAIGLRSIRFCLGVLVPLLVLGTSVLAENYALLVGIGSYPGLGKKGQLEGPAYDIAALEQQMSDIAVMIAPLPAKGER